MALNDFSAFIDATPEDIMADWLAYVQSRDPQLNDTSPYTFNSILAEAIASQFWIYIQLLKQKVQDSNILEARGEALSALALDKLPEGRQPGTRSSGIL